MVVEEGHEEGDAEIVDALHVAARGMTIRPDVEKTLQTLRVTPTHNTKPIEYPRSSAQSTNRRYGAHRRRSTLNASREPDLVQRGELLLRSLGIVHIEQTRNVVHVLPPLSLDDRLLATADRGEIALSVTPNSKAHQEQLPADRSVLRGNALPRQRAERLHIDSVALQETLVFCNVFVAVTGGEHHDARFLRGLYGGKGARSHALDTFP